MIDPDGIQIQETNLSNKINIKEVPEFDMEPYLLEDEKEYKHFIDDVERQVRRSFEYREFIKYLRDNMNMNRCSFLNDVSNEDTYDIKIEIHHYPFTLRDICEIVFNKREYYNESLKVQMVAKEVMELHYKLVIGLIPLSETVHELAHSGRLFVPVDKVLGRYNLFVDFYEPFCKPEQLDTLKRIEKYSFEQRSQLLNTTIIEQNNVSYNIEDEKYLLPDFTAINDNMVHQIETIKNNNYLLPDLHQYDELEEKKEVKQVVSFDMSLRDYNKYPKREGE